MNAKDQKADYTVKKLAELAGVSVRTLHLYDEIDLLKPSVRTEAGYRLYGEAELLRLQQILLYKEYGFSLQKIGEILDDPGFDLVEALENHRQELQVRQYSIRQLLQTLDKTINKIKNEMKMSHDELYEGLPKETANQYRAEAIEAWGEEAVKQSERGLLNMGKQDFLALKEEIVNVSTSLTALIKEAPESPHVQKLIARHYTIIRKFWGTHGSDDKQADAYAGLGDLYVNDPRFTSYAGAEHPEFALFLSRAMRYFANTTLK